MFCDDSSDVRTSERKRVAFTTGSQNAGSRQAETFDRRRGIQVSESHRLAQQAEGEESHFVSYYAQPQYKKAKKASEIQQSGAQQTDTSFE